MRLCVFLLAVSVWLVACGAERPPAGEDGYRPMITAGESTGITTRVEVGACLHEGQVEECSVVYAEHDGFHDCFLGEQTCRDGAWTPCQGDSAR